MLCGVDLVVAVEGLEPGGVVVAAASDASRRAAIAAAARGGGRVLVVSSVGFARLPPGKFSVVDGGDEWPADASNVAARAVDVRRALLSRGEACGAARRVVGGAATVIFDGVGVTAGDCLGLVAPRGPNRRLVVLLGRTDSRMSTVAAFLRLGGAAVAEWREPTAAHVEIYLGRNSVTKYDGSIDAAAWVRMFAAQQEVIQGSSTDVSKGKDAGECAAVRAAVAAMRARRGDDVLVVYTASRLDCERRAVSFLTTADNDDEMQPLDSARLKALAATVADDAALAGMLRRGVGIWHCGLLPAAREAVELAALAGLVRIIFATLDYPHQTARCVVATPKLLGEGGAVSSFDDYVHRLVEGAGRVEVCQLVEAFRECECDDALEVHDADESYGLALALRAALAGAPPAAVCEASLAHYEAAKRSGDGALRRNEARTCRLALRQIAARHGAAWLQPGRVARCGDGRWGVVLASVQGSAADVLVDDKRGARIERLHSNSLRLTCIRVFVGSGDLHRVEQRDGLVRSLRGALADCGGAKSKESKGGKKDDKKSKKKRKRLEAKHPRLEAKHARVEYIDDSGVIEARGADVRLAARVRTRLDALRGDSEDDDSDGEPESASARPGLASLVAEAQLARGDASNRTKRATQALLRLGLVCRGALGKPVTGIDGVMTVARGRGESEYASHCTGRCMIPECDIQCLWTVAPPLPLESRCQCLFTVVAARWQNTTPASPRRRSVPRPQKSSSRCPTSGAPSSRAACSSTSEASATPNTIAFRSPGRSHVSLRSRRRRAAPRRRRKPPWRRRCSGTGRWTKAPLRSSDTSTTPPLTLRTPAATARRWRTTLPLRSPLHFAAPRSTASATAPTTFRTRKSSRATSTRRCALRRRWPRTSRTSRPTRTSPRCSKTPPNSSTTGSSRRRN
ncbi:hypothetical protein M885DRAFT_584835 [Pelagophyceae sp. CCMP2097]|nr:hypothetical protein M885DRAFT_584835 [Pelagophyceae sp. CCMP2097]